MGLAGHGRLETGKTGTAAAVFASGLRDSDSQATAPEVKPWTGPLPRYPTSAVEPSRLDARGRIENGLMGAHRWPEPALAAFTKIIGELVAPDGAVARAASVFIGGPAVLIDTFYFELN